MRRACRVKGNASTRFGECHICLDTETRAVPLGDKPPRFRHVLRLGCASYFRLIKGEATRRREVVFREPEAFWDWVLTCLDPRRPVRLWCHNAGFDLTIADLWGQLEAERFGLKLAVLEDPPTIIVLTHERGKLWCLDTLNWFRMPLAELGAGLGVPKLPMPADDADQGAWIEYCRRDVEIVEATVCRLAKFIGQHDLGVLRPTAAGQAMQAFRHRFMKTPIILHNHQRAMRLEREAYFGGRSEAFYLGGIEPFRLAEPRDPANYWPHGHRPDVGPAYLLDVQGMFLHAMATTAVPHKLLDYGEGGSVANLRQLAKQFGVIAAVRLSSDRDEYPKRLKRSIVHASGRFWTVLCGDELVQALDRGQVLRVGRLATYAVAPHLADWAKYWWSMREVYRGAGQEWLAGLCKAIGLSLYGKWGQRANKWVDVPGDEPACSWGLWYERDPATGKPVTFRGLWSKSQRLEEYLTPLPEECFPKDAKGTEVRRLLGEHPFAFPAIAAFVTSAARCRMSGLRELAGRKNVWHQAVDAILVNQEGFNRLNGAGLVVENELGKLSEKWRGEEAVVWGLNDLELDGKARIAGVSGRAVHAGVGAWTQDKFERLDAVIERGPDGSVIVRRETIHKDRIWGEGLGREWSGWVEPVVIDESEVYNEAVAFDAVLAGATSATRRAQAESGAGTAESDLALFPFMRRGHETASG